jgi:maleylpyruvate isomerase
MNASAEARQAGIDSAAALPADGLRALLLDSATALGDAMPRLRDGGDDALGRLVAFGVPQPGAAADTPAWHLGWARLREVLIHHVDLNAGYSPADWPEPFVARMSDLLDARTGPRDVVGDPAEVVAWRLGRGAGPGVRAADGGDPGDPGPW